MTNCALCGKETTRKKDGSLCLSCGGKTMKLLRKLRLIRMKGGCCEKCGWTGHPSSLVFHHKDSSSKDGDLSKMMTGKWDVLLKEVEKCELLCANCHHTAHAGEADKILTFASAYSPLFGKVGEVYLSWLPDDKIRELEGNLEEAERRRDFGRKLKKTCLKCGSEFSKSVNSEGKFCSHKCYREYQQAETVEISKTCEWCKEKFRVRDDTKNLQRRFCSRRCSAASASAGYWGGS